MLFRRFLVKEISSVFVKGIILLVPVDGVVSSITGEGVISSTLGEGVILSIFGEDVILLILVEGVLSSNFCGMLSVRLLFKNKQCVNNISKL